MIRWLKGSPRHQPPRQQQQGADDEGAVPQAPRSRKLTQVSLEEPLLILGRRLGAYTARRHPRFYSRFVQSRYAFELLLERRLWLFLVADVLLLLTSFLAILSGGAKPYEVYRQAVVLPSLLIGLPAMAAVLSLERTAGSLDLALSVVSTERYFIRRLLPVGLCLLAQGWLVLVVALESSGDLLRSMFQSLVVIAFLGATTLFWAVRLRTAGAVLMASWMTVLATSKWVLFDPTIATSGGAHERLLGVALPVVDWFWNTVVLVVTTGILFLYARERLQRPETLIA